MKKANFEKLKLKNGSRVILAPEEHGLAATVLIIVSAGSHYETKEQSGISHFLEHMCFKGTKKYPTALAISSAFEGLGAEHNAFTGAETTSFYAKAEARHLPKIIDLLSDMYLYPIFDPAEIEKEKGVIMEEFNLYADRPEREVYDLFSALLYGDTPAGWKVLGDKKTVSRMSRDNFLDSRRENYLASSTVLVVAGKFKKGEVLKNLEKHFGGLKDGDKKEMPKTEERQTKSAIAFKVKKTDQTHFALGVRTFSYFDKRRYVLDVLASILGGGSSSRLYQKIREELGLAYYVGAGPSLYRDHGFMSAFGGVKTKALAEVVAIIIEEFKRIKEEIVSEEELKRTKDRLIGSLALGLETSDEVAWFYGEQEILEKKIVSPEEIMKKIRSVTAEEVRALAQEILQSENLNLAVVGPHQNKKKFERLLKI